MIILSSMVRNIRTIGNMYTISNTRLHLPMCPILEVWRFDSSRSMHSELCSNLNLKSIGVSRRVAESQSRDNSPSCTCIHRRLQGKPCTSLPHHLGRTATASSALSSHPAMWSVLRLLHLNRFTGQLLGTARRFAGLLPCVADFNADLGSAFRLPESNGTSAFMICKFCVNITRFMCRLTCASHRRSPP